VYVIPPEPPFLEDRDDRRDFHAGIVIRKEGERSHSVDQPLAGFNACLVAIVHSVSSEAADCALFASFGNARLGQTSGPVRSFESPIRFVLVTFDALRLCISLP
jgi:hypothetical protein